ncbi:MAG: class I mannose-6-phosphate isomerase [Candidatus Omnitrophica bacterium]|nr:class I mannose-6-phosphate isomerase [Candidatus Omnitrophota bacterium]
MRNSDSAPSPLDLDSAPESGDLHEMLNVPLRFVQHNFADYIWGGYELYKFKKIDIRDHHPAVAESWEISGHEKYPSTVTLSNGKEISLPELLSYPGAAAKVLGSAAAKRFLNNFPLIIKFFDVQKHMSVQVHPTDEIARSFGEKDPGKGEIFIVLDVYPGAEGALYLGLKDGVNRAQFEKALKGGSNLLDLMHKIHVKKGEIYELPSGVIHCWTGGTMAVEITEASDLTYRLYDFGRGRPMHYEKGLASIDFENQSGPVLENRTRISWKATQIPGIEKIETQSEMSVQRICLNGDMKFIKSIPAPEKIFDAILCLKGSAVLKSVCGNWKEEVAQGYALLIPSGCSAYDAELNGSQNCEFLKISMELNN